MSSTMICGQCLRAAARSALRVQSTSHQTQRAISTPASNAFLQKRQIHQTTRQRQARPELQRQTAADIPPDLPQQARQTQPPPEQPQIIIPSNKLFNSYTNSPSPAIRRRAAFIRQNAYCPHPAHQPTRLPTSPHDAEHRKTGALPPAHARFECPDCGIPISCSEEHYMSNYENHLEVCDTLRQVNEDDHDLLSGRLFPEFEYPGPQVAEEAQINMMNWDTLLYSRDFTAINHDRNMRQVTRLLTYPLSIASIVHELSPYSIRDRLTPEGLRSMSALQYTLHPPRTGAGITISGLRPNPPPVRLFILGARAESSLPREVWLQLAHLFPRVTFHLVFIGPESMANRDSEFPLPPRTPQNPFGTIVETGLAGVMKISTYVEYFHTLHEAQMFAPYDPYFDCFVLFHPGLGHPASSHEWAETLPQLLETKVPIICTGYTEFDMQRDIDWVAKQASGEMDLLVRPGENRFRSLRWDLNDADPEDVSCGNWGIWGFRGKRYEADEYRGRSEE